MTEIIPMAIACSQDLPKTARAFAMVRDGQVLGHAGAILAGPAYIVYSNIQQEGWKDIRAVLRLWRRIIGTIRHRGLPIQAIADPRIEASGRFLEHLGFHHLIGDTYEWEGQ